MVRSFAAFLALLLAACGAAPRTAPLPPESLQIAWLGHNCFLLTTGLGFSVLTDPFETKYFDYPTPAALRPDVVLISSEDPHVSNAELADGSPQIFRNRSALGDFSAGGIPFHGAPTSEDDNNVAFVWTMNGIRLCHLGLIGGPLSQEARERLGHVDVLFLPVGNPLALTDEMRAEIVRALTPRLIVPMSYANSRTTRLAFAPLEGWLGAQKAPIRRLRGPSFTLTRAGLPKTPLIILPAVP